MVIKLKIKRNDSVIVISGKDKGKIGQVIKVLPQLGRVCVSGVNLAKRHVKPDRTGGGGIIEKEMFIHISNVSILDKATSKPTKVGSRILEDGRKVRFAKKSGEVLDN